MVVSPQRIKEISALPKEELIVLVASFETENAQYKAKTDTLTQERNELLKKMYGLEMPTSRMGMPQFPGAPTPPRPVAKPVAPTPPPPVQRPANPAQTPPLMF